MIPESGNWFSDKIMLKQKAKAKSRFDLASFRFSFMMAQWGAECAAYPAAADRRVRQLRAGQFRVGVQGRTWRVIKST
jgi:hypothetical protein